MIAMPSACQIADDAMDFGLGAHVDAARWLIQNQQFGACVQPLGQHHLLLVATGEFAHDICTDGCANGEPLAIFLAGGDFVFAPHKPQRGKIVAQHGQRNVGGDGHGQGKPKLAAIFGGVGNFSGNGLLWRANLAPAGLQR